MVNILFICHGNICRSPIAEFVMKDMAKGLDIHIESKAVSREELGNPVYPPAAAILRQHNIPFGGHRARQITREDYDAFDYILVAEEYNIPRLMRIIGSDVEKKVYRMLDFTEGPGDIEDPWYTGNFEKVYQQIRSGCEALLSHLQENNLV